MATLVPSVAAPDPTLYSPSFRQLSFRPAKDVSAFVLLEGRLVWQFAEANRTQRVVSPPFSSHLERIWKSRPTFSSLAMECIMAREGESCGSELA